MLIKKITNYSKDKFKVKQLFYLFGDICIYIYILLTFSMEVLYYNKELVPIKSFFLIIGGTIGFINSLKTFNKKILFLIFLFVFSFIAVYLSGKALVRLPVLIYTLLHIGLALNLISHKHSPKISEIIYYFCISSMIIKIILFGGNLKNYMLGGVSENYISILGLLLLGIYVVFLDQNNIKTPFLAVLLFLVLTLSSRGRGGILSGVLLFLLTLLDKVFSIKKKKKKIFTSIIIVFSIILSAIIIINSSPGKKIFRKFSERGSIQSESRLLIWHLFFRDTFKSLKSIVLGGKLNTAAHEDGNLHNSFLLCYGYYGLIPFLTIIFIYIYFIIKSLKHDNKTLLIFAIVFFVRSNTDRMFYQGYNEFLLYYILFNSINANKTNNMFNKSIKYLKEQYYEE